jgi:hypothetical protein
VADGMIRQAKCGDIPALTELMLDMYRRSQYVEYDEPDIKETKSILLQAITRHGLKAAGGTCVFVIEEDGTLTGFIIGVLERFYHIGKKLSATDLFYYAIDGADPREAIRLFDAYLEWARKIPNVIRIRNGATDAIGDYGKVEKLYQRRGLTQEGVIYGMWVERPKEESDVGRG